MLTQLGQRNMSPVPIDAFMAKRQEKMNLKPRTAIESNRKTDSQPTTARAKCEDKEKLIANYNSLGQHKSSLGVPSHIDQQRSKS